MPVTVYDDIAFSGDGEFVESIIVRIFACGHINILGIYESTMNSDSFNHRRYINLRVSYGKVICNALVFIKNLFGKNNLKTLLLPRGEGSGWQIAEKNPRHEDIHIDETYAV